MVKDTSGTLSNILNIAGVLVALSFVFYFSGLMYASGYALAVGIPQQLFQRDYYPLVTRGVLGFFPLLPLILYCLGTIYRISWFRHAQEPLQKHLKDIAPMRSTLLSISATNETQKEKIEASLLTLGSMENELNETLAKLSSIEKEYLAFWNSKKEGLTIGALITFFVIVSCVLDIIISHGIIFEQLIQTVLTTGVLSALGYFIYRHIKSMMEYSPFNIFRAILYIPLLLLFILILPAGDGASQGKVDLRTKNFDKVTVIASTGILKGYFISVSSYGMDFLIDDKVVIIPQSEIKALDAGW